MSDRPAIFAVLKGVVEILALPSAYLFFTGFIYAYYYFKHFGISLQDIDLSAQYFFIYAFSVFLVHWPWILVTVCVVGAIWILGSKCSSFWATVALICILIGLFPVLWSSAREMGQERAILIRNGIGARRLTLNLAADSPARCAPRPDPAAADPSGEDNKTRPGENERDCLPPAKVYFLLASTDEFFVVLDQGFPPFPELPAAQVHWVPKRDVALASVEIINTSKVGAL